MKCASGSVAEWNARAVASRNKLKSNFTIIQGTDTDTDTDTDTQ